MRRWQVGVVAILVVGALRVSRVLRASAAAAQADTEAALIPSSEALPAKSEPEPAPPVFEVLRITRPPPKTFALTDWQRKKGIVVEFSAHGLDSRFDLPNIALHAPCEQCAWGDETMWGVCNRIWLFDSAGKEVLSSELVRDAGYSMLCLATTDDFPTEKPQLSRAVVAFGGWHSKVLPIGPALTQYQEARTRLTALAFGFKRKSERGAQWELLVQFEGRFTSIVEDIRLISKTGVQIDGDDIFETGFDGAKDGFPKREGRALLLIRTPPDFVPASLTLSGKKVPLPTADALAKVPSAWHRWP